MQKPFKSKEEIEDEEWTENAEKQLNYLHTVSEDIKEKLKKAFEKFDRIK